MARLQQGYLFDNRYQLLRKLGEGGYSEVWLVQDTVGEMELVLKIFLPDAQLDNKMVDLFRKEFQLVYNINHPNLLKYSQFNVCMGYPYLVMPYYRLGSAESLIGRCSEQTGWKYLRDVAAGLARLHAQRPAIIHQDIKPANVLLDSENFIITDFGISASMYSLVKGSSGNKVVQGTRPYMPPEKYLENPEIYPENDIWSLGASLYELLTGELPFGSKGGAMQLEVLECPELPATFSTELRYVVRKCLSSNPGHRPTAKELSSYADKMVKNPPPPPPPTPPQHTDTPISPLYNSQDPLTYPPYGGGYPSYGRSRNNLSMIMIAAASVIGIALVVFFTIFLFNHQGKGRVPDTASNSDTTKVDSLPSGKNTGKTITYTDAGGKNKNNRTITPKYVEAEDGEDVNEVSETEFLQQHTNEMILSGKQ